jgi:signal transduction histidine kinase
MFRLGRLFVFTAELIIASAGIGVAEDGGPDHRRVLIVYEPESTLQAVVDVSRGLHQTLRDRSPTSVEFYTEYLDFFRFPGDAHRRRQAESLTAKYEHVSLDAVVTLGPGALRFMLENRDAIAPGRPLVYGGVNATQIEGIPLQPDTYGVISRFDVVETVNLAMRLQPDAERIVVLSGSAPFDRDWERSARADLGARFGRREVDYVTGLSLEGFKTKARKLSRKTILVLLTILEDAEGRKFVPADVVAEIAPISGAPAYAIYSSHIGTGVVGGVMSTFESLGEDLGALVEKVMNGAAPEPRSARSEVRPIIDWRQLERWQIDEDLLPPNAVLEYYEPSAWELYRFEILAAAGIIILQSATIAGLIVTDRRRRRIREQLAQERLELAHLSRSIQLGALSGSFAHELNQPLTAILANAEVGSALLETEPADRGAIKEILNDIIADDKRASEVIKNLRELMLKGETNFDRVDLNQCARETIKLMHGELIARETTVDFRSEHLALPVNANLVQLKQVVLNLMMNAVEAMSSIPVPKRKIEIATRMRDNGLAELTIADFGPGLSPDVERSATKPFVTTKAGGLGLGLAICRSIAEAHGGSIEFNKRREVGACVVFTLPAA